jgi:SAM-dependent methyltransferase
MVGRVLEGSGVTGSEAVDRPDRKAALEQYRRAASGYDRHMRRFARWQRLAVERLELRSGEAVIDVACGTGVNFPLLQAEVGPTGRIVGIDLSPEMLARARDRVAAEGWRNVTLIEAAVEEAHIEERADAALFSFTHFFVRRAARPYLTTFSGLDRPWRELERYTGEMQHRSLALGGAHVAWGRIIRKDPSDHEGRVHPWPI